MLQGLEIFNDFNDLVAFFLYAKMRVKVRLKRSRSIR